MIKVLILIPAQSARGGISNYYFTLKKYFSESIIYQYRGARNYPYKRGILFEGFRLIIDYLIFISKIFKHNISLVQTSTALDKKAVLRDGLFILFAKLLRKKVIVFYRGWDKNFEPKAKSSLFYKYLFLKADGSIVLSKFQKDILISWGYKKNIYIESTVVDDEITNIVSKNFIYHKYDSINKNSKITLLYLARLEKTKGIFELLEAYAQFKKKYNIELIVTGDGTAESGVQDFIRAKKLKDIETTGFVSGQKKYDIFKKSHVYIFPSYSEGMPNSVLEAMAFGLPVLTTPVGGLVDFFENDYHGSFIKKYDVNSIIIELEKLINSKEIMKKIALNNHKYAVENFLASKVAKRNEEIFKQILSEKKNVFK